MKRWLVRNGWFIFTVLFIAIYLLFFRTAEVIGISMEPTYNNDDFLFLHKTSHVNRNDIIVVYSESLNKLLCKRVIGVSGDHIVINNYGLSVNDVLLDEPYVSTKDWYSNIESVDVIVPVDSIFVLGDNRVVSNDSRKLGCIAINDVVGVSIINITKLFGLRKKNLVYYTTGLFAMLLLVELMFKGFDSKKLD